MATTTKAATTIVVSVQSKRKYRLDKLLGEGGFGSVYRCTTPKVEGALCLKLTTDQASWHREAYMAELLGDHPRVVKIHETFPIFDGKKVSYAVVMELADHGTLADVVEKGGAWPEARAVGEISKLLTAIDTLHACGALHRDITPYNVFVCGEAQSLKLGDFGITTHGPKRGVRADAFAPWFVDTQIRVEQKVRWDVREDLWQVAQVLAVLLTGKIEPTRAADVRKIEASSATRAVIARATGERAHRFEGAREMIEALKDARPAKAKAATKGAKAKGPTSLKGRNVVFTGKLGIPRDEATRLAEAAGAIVGRSFTTKTDLLVVGTSKLWAAGDAGGRKLLAAAAHDKERNIDRVDEARFLALVAPFR